MDSLLTGQTAKLKPGIQPQNAFISADTVPALLPRHESFDSTGGTAHAVGTEAHGEGRPGAEGNLSRRAAGFSRAKPRILAVDDDAVNLKLLSVMLGKGYQVEAAHSAKEAQELFSKGGYALVLLDLHMPGASGYDCARELRKMEKTNGWKPVPFLALTADNTPQAARQSSAAGMDAVLLKPFEYRQLLAAAKKWCRPAKPAARRY